MIRQGKYLLIAVLFASLPAAWLLQQWLQSFHIAIEFDTIRTLAVLLFCLSGSLIVSGMVAALASNVNPVELLRQ